MAEIYLVASGKGGVGKSSFTVAIAKALAARDKSVLIVDADVGLRSLDLFIEGTEAVLYDWGDIINGRCEPEAAIITDKGISLLTCPLEYGDEFTGEAFGSLIEQFGSEYDFIVIDAPAGIGNVLKMACHAAKNGIVIATPDNVCVRSACIAAQVMEENGVENTRLIINRFRPKAVEKKKLMNIDGVIDNTGVQLLGVIPEDPAIGYGTVYTSRQISTPSINRIARRLCGENIPLFN
ncbi:MAG: P-loop NTPase [Clostridia bacterium]|nr:P-loop NTPase [Clostridia bacterium]